MKRVILFSRMSKNMSSICDKKKHMEEPIFEKLLLIQAD